MEILAYIGIAFIVIMVLLFFSFMRKKSLLKKQCLIFQAFFRFFNSLQNEGLLDEDDMAFILECTYFYERCLSYLNGRTDDLYHLNEEANKLIDKLYYIKSTYSSKNQ